MVTLADLFPNSTDKLVKQLKENLLVHLDPASENAKALTQVMARAMEHMKCSIPICISLGTLRESNGCTTYMVIIVRDGARIETDHSEIRGRVKYAVDMWKHVLLGHLEPDILAYDVDPPKEQP